MASHKPIIMSKVKPTGRTYLGQQVTVPDLGIIGEVAEISQKTNNLITKIKVKTKEGFKFVDVENLVVEAVYLVREIRLSQAFKILLNALKSLLRKK